MTYLETDFEIEKYNNYILKVDQLQVIFEGQHSRLTLNGTA